jgi:hypothetical protein
LSQYQKPKDRELVIAINRAILHIQPHWWVFLDKAAPRLITEAAPPPWFRDCNWCTFKAMFEENGFESRSRDFTLGDHRKQNYGLSVPHINMPRGQSMGVGIALARHLGATKINVYGADFDGKTYFDGTPVDGTEEYIEGRWKRLRDVFEQHIKRCKDEGVEVIRHTMKGDTDAADKTTDL